MTTPEIKEQAMTFASKFKNVHPDVIETMVDGLIEILSTPSDKSSMEAILSKYHTTHIEGKGKLITIAVAKAAMFEFATNKTAKATAEMERQIRTLERFRLEDAHSHIQDQIMSNDKRKELEARIKELEATLRKIDAWELPDTGEFWDEEKTRPVQYGANWGSNGERDYIRSVARVALYKGAELMIYTKAKQ